MMEDLFDNYDPDEIEDALETVRERIKMPNTAQTYNLNELAAVIRAYAIAHGWEDKPRSFGEEIALWHSEASEAFEEFRKGHAENEIYYSQSDYALKPEGIPVEAADIIIRILHWASKTGIDMQAVVLEKMAYNETRPYRHGGKIV